MSPTITLTTQTATMATPPPGLEGFGPIQAVASGGSGEWLDLPPVKLYTNSFIIMPGKVISVDFNPVRLLIRDRPPIRFCSATKSGASGRACRSKNSGCALAIEVRGLHGSQVQWFRREGRARRVGRSCRTERAQGDVSPHTLVAYSSSSSFRKRQE